MDPWQMAIQNAQLGANYLQNSNYVAGKANEFRTVAVERLREIYGRLLSIQDEVAVMQQAAGAAGNAQAALVELIDAVNAQGYIEPQQAQAMEDLATQLQGIDIPLMMAGLMGEVNAIAGAVGVAAGPPRRANAADQGPIPLVGGRRKRKKGKKTRRKKKKHKGGFKYSRIANSRRSLRMTRRKSLRHKKHHKKHKRTKKHRRRKRR